VTLDESNPFVIVNNFMKNHPNNDGQIDFKLISSILSRHINNFYLTQEEFDMISNILPVRL
jgi:hypothetical protein